MWACWEIGESVGLWADRRRERWVGLQAGKTGCGSAGDHMSGFCTRGKQGQPDRARRCDGTGSSVDQNDGAKNLRPRVWQVGEGAEVLRGADWCQLGARRLGGHLCCGGGSSETLLKGAMISLVCRRGDGGWELGPPRPLWESGYCRGLTPPDVAA